MHIDPSIVFHEEQQFRQWWLIAGLVGSFLFTVIILLVAGSSVRKANPATFKWFVAIAIVLLTFEIVFNGLFLGSKMITDVRDGSITVRAWPIAKLQRVIPIDQVTKCEARTYDPIGEYGGWGIRLGAQGKAYNISGNRGVQLELKSGEKVLIGSQKADELAAAIRARKS